MRAPQPPDRERCHHGLIALSHTRLNVRAAYAIGVLLAASTVALGLSGCGGGSAVAPAKSSTHRPSAPRATQLTGLQIFDGAGCGQCHTLAAAKADGVEGPDLDEVQPSYARVVRQVESGGVVMPGFAGQLTQAQIDAVSRFVVRAEQRDRASAA